MHAGRVSGAPSISCVIPVFNGERHLAETIDSVRAQTCPALEILVVDDGSTDASARIAEDAADVRVLRQANGGTAAARQAGILAARGTFVALLDADDLWHPEKLARQLARFEARPGLDVSVAMAENFWEDGLEDEESRYRAVGKVRAAHHFSSILTRRELLAHRLPLRVGYRAVDHFDWFMRAADAGLAVDVIDEVLVRRRMHRSSLSHTSDQTAEYLDLIKASLDRRRAATGPGC